MSKKIAGIILVSIILITAFLLIEQKKYQNELAQLPNTEDVCGTGGGCSISDDIEFGYTTGMYIPNITLTDFDGNEYQLYDLMEGKDWFILSFGVEWCSDCKRDHEKIATYYDQLPEEIGYANVYIDYSKEDDPDKQTTYEEAKEDAKLYPFPSYYDVDNELMEAFNVKNTPTTVVIQGDGKIKAVTSEMDLDKLLLPNTETLEYPVPTQETYDAAQQ